MIEEGKGGKMDVHETVKAAVEPLLAPRGIELFDVEIVGAGNARVLRLSVDRDGGVDLDTIAEVSHLVSPVLDADELIDGAYTLEVSSPGLERPLRLPAHFRRVVGQTIAVKTHREVDGERRHQGALANVDDDGITIDIAGTERRVPFADVASARTVFEWGPAPKPGSGANKRQKNQPKKTTRV
ncbi:MAG TPA: ribosome maturation factor RimP [Acidimicrobiia bacterium]|nr:ribosome maturation factor RimP [Acidimicrobiia bacterium]